jgi:hypothetical protein
MQFPQEMRGARGHALQDAGSAVLQLRRTALDQVVSQSRRLMPGAASGLAQLRESALFADSQRLRRKCLLDFGVTNDASGGDRGRQ